MWAYIDETGNTGNHLFDEEQPFYITAAFMTKTNFDMAERRSLATIAAKVGSKALHANELGVARIETIAPDLLKVLKRADPRFFVSRLEKRFLASTKVIDTYFDQGENLAVPWHVYWLRPLRMMMTFKMAKFVITEEIAKTVWNCLTAGSEATSKTFFVEGAKALLERVDNLPDARSRQIVREALEWAAENPENFTTFLKDKVKRYQHSPNFVAFTNLLDGLDRTSKRWQRPIREIVHDQQSEFEKTFTSWHAVVSRPDLLDVKPYHWPGETEPITVARVSGSVFRTATEDTSPGLQVVDVIIWLFKRVFSEKSIGQECAKLLNWVSRRAYQHDFSFIGVGEHAEQAHRRIMRAEISEESVADSRKMVADQEVHRQRKMAEYAKTKAGAGLAIEAKAKPAS